ncbi:MAG: ATP-binding cassette domain-containing protein [Actinomycetota bacterium]
MLHLRALTKRYGDLTALDGVSFDVAPGRVTGLLGANGAGKTTTMRAILGLVRLDEGDLRWNDDPIDRATRLRFGYLPEQRGVYPKMKVGEQVTYFGELHGMSRPDARRSAAELLDLVGLADRSDDMVEALSHGNQQRVQLAVSLVHRPSLLVLDEPFSGLDPLGVDAMSDALIRVAGEGAAVVLSSHQLELVEDVAEDVVMLAAGRVVRAGAVDTVRSSARANRLEVELDEPVNGSTPLPIGASIVDAVGNRLVIEVDDATTAHQVLGAFGERRLRSFRFEPATLAEVFKEAVSL